MASEPRHVRDISHVAVGKRCRLRASRLIKIACAMPIGVWVKQGGCTWCAGVAEAAGSGGSTGSTGSMGSGGSTGSTGSTGWQAGSRQQQEAAHTVQVED